MSALKLAVFDMDGTLMDSQDFIFEAMALAFAEMREPVPERADILSIVGLSLYEAIARLRPDMPDGRIEMTSELYKQSFIRLRAERGGEATAPLYPGARDALDALHRRDEVLMGVATGKAMRGLEHACKAHDLGHFFVTRQTADHHPSKPHPSMVLSCLSETGAEAENTVMIGDTTYDIEMGRAAGVRTLGVAWGYHTTEALMTAGADMIVTHFSDVPDALERLWG